MKRMFLLIMAVILLTGCSANKYVLEKIDAYDNNFAAIGGKIDQVDANFKIIQQHFVTKEILQKYKPECPDCICNYTVEEVINMEEEKNKEATEETQEETTQEEKTSEESTQSEESQSTEENTTDEEKTEEESTSTEEESKEEGSETESKEEESESAAGEEESSNEGSAESCEATAQEAKGDAPQGRVGV